MTTYRVTVEIKYTGTVTVEAGNPHEAVHLVNKMLAGPEPEEVLDTEPSVVEARGIRAYEVGEIQGPD